MSDRLASPQLRAVGLVLFLLSACGEEQPSQPTPTNFAAEPRPQPSPSPQLPAEASLAERPFSPTSAQGAATVVETYYGLIEAGKYAEALKLRWDADRVGLDRFAASFAPYAEHHATVGAPSAIQGAAGSLYVEVPVQLYGNLKSGKPFGTVGTITLRRVNDIPGSTAEQRRWRIYTSE